MHRLFEGAYDLHVHSGPDLVPRIADDPEMCRRFSRAGFRGWCIKSHYFCTAERARLMNADFPGLNVVGAIALNATVGGLNVQAVDAAGRDGAKLVWLPTFDARNEIDFTFGPSCTYDTTPAWALRMKERREKGLADNGISVLDESGQLTPAARDVMACVGERDMVLCTGHLSRREIRQVVRSAGDLGVRRVIVTHATWASVALTADEQAELAGYGARIEQCSGNMKAAYGTTWEKMYAVVRRVGAENCILSSDCGNRNKPYPDQSLDTFAEKLLENGFTERELRIMAVDNPTALIEG